MPYPTLYPAQTNSPSTTLAAEATASDTNLTVVSGAILPEPPTYLTIGNGTDAETVLMTAKNGNNISVVRGVDGAPQSWNANEPISRVFAAKDHNDLIESIETLKADVGGKASAVHNQKATSVTLDPIDGMTSLQVQAGIGELKGRADDLQLAVNAAQSAAAIAHTEATKGVNDAAAALAAATTAQTSANAAHLTADGKVGSVNSKTGTTVQLAAADIPYTNPDMPDVTNAAAGINAAFTRGNEVRGSLVALVDPAAPDDTFEIGLGKLQTANNTGAAALVEKGVEADASDGTAVLMGKIAEIPAGGGMKLNLGDGSNGEFDSTGNVTLNGAGYEYVPMVLQYTSFRLNAGHVLTVDRPIAALVILVQGECVIDGTIDLSTLGQSVSLNRNTLLQAMPEMFVDTGIRYRIPLLGGGGNGGNGGTTNSGAGGAGGTGGSGFGQITVLNASKGGSGGVYGTGGAPAGAGGNGYLGWGGAGGGGGTSASSSKYAGAGGGVANVTTASKGPGGRLVLCAFGLMVSGTINTNALATAIAGSGSSSSFDSTGGGMGGYGGGGVDIYYIETISIIGTITVSGGAAGAAGPTGSNKGSAGTSGTAGIISILKV